MKELDFALATKAHADWKTKLREAISNEGQIDAETLSKDNLCALGHWLYDENTKDSIGGTETYEECRESHATFHKEAGKVAVQINRANYDVAEDMLKLGTSYDEASRDVALALHELRKEITK